MNKSRPIIVTGIIALFIWMAFAPPKNLSNVRITLANTIRLPLKVFTVFRNYVGKISQLPYSDSEKILSLKHKIYDLEKRLVESEETRLENERLRGLLDFKKNLQKISIPALVIGRDPNNWSSVVFIDKGTNDGIMKDTVVISGQGLVGRVREAAGSMSKVMLINDVDSKVGAIVQKSREQGLLVGMPEGSCRIVYLSLDSEVDEGDEVLTSGMGGIYPKGIRVGEVVKVSKEKGRLYKYAVVKPSCELSKLEEVLCIK